jgi:hypothetical protein
VIFVFRSGDQDLHRDFFSLLFLSIKSKVLAATEYRLCVVTSSFSQAAADGAIGHRPRRI